MQSFFGRLRAGHAGWLALALAASACSCGDQKTQAQLSQFEIELEEDETGQADYVVDFGVVPLGERRTRSVHVRNRGSAALVVEAGEVERPFLLELPAGGVSVPVGGSATLPFAFEPKEESAAPTQHLLTLSTNETKGAASHTIRLVGQGRRAALACSPAALDFGAVIRGESRSLSLRCENLLPVAIEARVGGFHGNFAQFFSATTAQGDGHVQLPAGGAIELTVRFQAQSLGSNDAILELVDSYQQELAAVQLVGIAVETALQVEPSTCLDFSYVGVGETARRSLLLRNIGSEPMRVSGARVAAGSSPDFTVLSEGPLLLEPAGDPLPVEVEFHPSVSGPSTAQIELVTDDSVSGDGVVRACVKGFGGGPAIACTPQSLDLGMVAVGMERKRSFQCVNAGEPVPGATVDPLIVAGVRSSHPTFSATIRNEDGSVGPKASGYAAAEVFSVEVAFAPEEEGFEAATIEVLTPSAAGGSLELLVSGQGRDLPPCDALITPSNLRFGLVDRGHELTLSFGVQNLQPTACLVHDLHLAPGSDPAFSLEAVESVELEGYGILEVPVSFAPTAYGANLEGAVAFTISDPSAPQREVPLRGSAAKPCLLIEPAEMDFGKVGPGCEARPRYFTVANLCALEITVTLAEIADSLGGEHFRVLSRSTLPRKLRTNERIEFSVAYAPQAEGFHSGAVIVEAEGSGPYLAAMVGEAVPNPIQVDSFNQKARPKVDILWVMDNSGSFAAYQERIAENLPAFLTIANQQNIDYHIAVTTSGLTPSGSSCPGGANGGEDGRFFPIDGSRPRILTPTTPDLADHWAHNMRVGECHSVEQYYEAAFRALSSPLIDEAKDSRYAGATPYLDGNAGFLRRDASLSIIFVADERDQSLNFGRSVGDYLDFFKGLKGYNMFRAHAITGRRSGTHGPSCGADEGDRLLYAVEETEGTWLDICTPKSDTAAWEGVMEKMSEGAFGFAARFYLVGQPGDRDGDRMVDEDDISVVVDGHPQPPINPQTKAQIWTYDPHANAIDFSPLFIPRPGSQVTATYSVACTP